MTLVRRLAVRISGAVVRWASPGCEEWAQAQAREIEFIAGDWAALAWAIGSMRVALDRRRMPVGSGSKPARPGFLNAISWLLYLEGCVWGCAKMLTSTGWLQRAGWGLVLLGVAYWATCSVFDWLRERWQPPTSDIQAYRLFLREGLELKLARYRTVRRWFPELATLSVWTGYMLIVRGDVHSWGYFILIVWALQHSDTPAKIQGRIERMDALIAAVNVRRDGKRLHSDHWGRPLTSKRRSACRSTSQVKGPLV